MIIDQDTTTLSALSNSSSKREDRSAKIVATVFPLIILGAPIGRFLFPAQTAPFVKGVNYALMIIMFGMGLALMPPDFGVIARHPWPVLMGVPTRYITIPLTILAMTWVSRSGPALAVGVILVGRTPGETALNVVVYLVEGDVAPSVTMTAVSALLSPLVTPVSTKCLAGQYMPVDAVAMAKPTMIIVFIPVTLGLLLRSFLPKFVEAILPTLPWTSVFGISCMVIALMGASSMRILSAGLVVPAAVIVHNDPSLILGCFATKGLKVGEKTVHTTAIEIDVQDSGLVTTLDATYFIPGVAIPGTVFSVWYSVSSSALAAFLQRRPITD